MQNCCAIMHSMKKAVKETPYAESDRKPMSPTESISMEETYNGGTFRSRSAEHEIRTGNQVGRSVIRVKYK